MKKANLSKDKDAKLEDLRQVVASYQSICSFFYFKGEKRSTESKIRSDNDHRSTEKARIPHDQKTIRSQLILSLGDDDVGVCLCFQGERIDRDGEIRLCHGKRRYQPEFRILHGLS